MVKLSINAVTNYSGGGTTVLLGYLRAWREMGADLDVTVYSSQESVLDEIRGSYPDWRAVPFGVGLPLHRRLAKQLASLGRNVASSGAQIVLGTNIPVLRCPIPQIVHHQSLLLFEHRSWLRSWQRGTKNLLQVMAARHALHSAAANVFISDHLRSRAERIDPASRVRNHVIPNGLPDEVLDAVGRPSEWSGDPGLLAVTSEEPYKDNELLPRILADLTKRHAGVSWSLDVAGEGRFEPVRRLARELGVADRIRWHGFVEGQALEALYRRSACLLYTSPFEGFGLPPIEAMARSCPVVASRNTAIPDVVADAALLVEPGNVRQFADAVARLLDNRELRAELIGRGAGRAAAFRWSESAARFQRLIQTLARNARSPAA